MMTKRYNSEQMLADIMAATATMTEDEAAHAVVVEGAPSDDALLGGLFKATARGIVSVEAYSTLYDMTDTEGRFTTSRARLAATRMLAAYRTRG
jgi:hypothetical protein